MAGVEDQGSEDQDPPEFDPARPPLVAIGASAGGVHALQELFGALTEPIGAIFVVVVHLDPEHQSELASIIGARTRMPVVQVDDVLPLEVDHVYVIPPGLRLRITDSEIAAERFNEPRGRRAPIDLFFRSLAEQRGDGFAVVLTGSGSDGSGGVRAVKEAGGIILVQDPNEAEYPSMPRSAIATGVVDFILPIGEIATKLKELAPAKRDPSGIPLAASDEDVVKRILSHLALRTGHDFTKYKRSTMLRRIARRMQVTRREHFADYLSFLRENVEEARALFSDLLISVTSFFRDQKAFESLEQRAIPELFDGKGPGEPIRVWVAGCATGEEAYSIGILLLEEAARCELPPEIQVFGSDLDAGALAVARQGRYPASIEADVGEERLRRFFTRDDDHYVVRRELRDILLFATHSLLKDPPFSRLDLISCRNLLIYLRREMQQQVCSTLHYALNPDGFLFLGVSENADVPTGLFRFIDREARIYQSTGRNDSKLPSLPRLLGSPRVGETMAAYPRETPGTARGDAVSHRRALEQMAPPSILVDDSHRAIHLSDSAGRYLQPAGGPLSTDLTDLLRPELRFDLRTALHRAFELGEATLSLPILVRFNGTARRVYLHVRPVHQDGDRGPRQALVLFIEGEGEAASPPPGGTETTAERRADDDNMRRLREELQLTQTRLRSTREEFEAANEELRATNEELQSINEEYRSTSEELETSKEELQSINEELQTVNNELKLKLESVSRAHSDLQNLMAATDFGTLFLDTTLRIKRFTPRVTDLFNITLSDEGRSITDFTHQLDYDALAADARQVLDNLVPVEREIRSREGRWFLVRLRPYRTVDDKIDGIVVTFIDVTARRQVEETLRDREVRLHQLTRLVDLSRAPIFVWEFDGGILEWNRGSEELYGYSREEALGKPKEVLLRTQVPGSSFAALKQEIAERGSWAGELQHTTKDGRLLWVETHIELEQSGPRQLVLESTRDVTEAKAHAARQDLLLRELNHRVKNTLAVVHSLAQQTMRNSRSLAEFSERFDGRLMALSRAHTLLFDSGWRGAELGALAHGQLDVHAGGNPARLRIFGEPVVLPPDLATPFGLVFHELGTNAAKYGSLSDGKGSIELSWRVNALNGQSSLHVEWQERGGPKVEAPTARGFGSVLIERGLPSAQVKQDYRADGYVCTIEVPLQPEPRSGSGR